MKKWVDELKASKGYTRLGGTGFATAANSSSHSMVPVTLTSALPTTPQ